MRRPWWPWSDRHGTLRTPSRKRRARLGIEALEERSLLSVGNLDPLFNNTGLLVVNALGSDTQANAVAVLRDNVDTTADPILVAGRRSGDFLLAKLEADGMLLNSTRVDFGGNDQALALAVGKDNKITLGGTSAGPDGSRAIVLARFTAGLALDNTFGAGGKVT